VWRTLASTGDGTVELPVSALAGTGEHPYSGNGAVEFAGPSLAATGELPNSGSRAVEFAVSAFAGSGVIDRAATARSAVVFCVARHPSGHTIASASLDTVWDWDARTGRKDFQLPAAPGKIALPYQAVAFSPDGRYLVTGKIDGALQVLECRDRREDLHARKPQTGNPRSGS
jgi:WD40 repeat protein